MVLTHSIHLLEVKIVISPDGYGDSGYGDSGYGNSGYGGDTPPAPYGSPESTGPGYGTSGYEDTPNDGTPNTGLGAGNNPYRTRSFADGYRGNPFEANVFDTPYTESSANPIPQGEGYGKAVLPTSGYRRPTAQDYGDDDELVL